MNGQKNSIIGLSNYPATGEDYVIQTTCEDFELDDKGITTIYNDGDFGIEGTHSYPSGGGSNFIKYNIKDDPFGLKQLKSFELIANYYGPSKNYTRSIHSVYTHTWAAIGVEVSVQAGVDLMLLPEIGIDIQPTINGFSWDLFANVTFRF